MKEIKDGGEDCNLSSQNAPAPYSSVTALPPYSLSNSGLSGPRHSQSPSKKREILYLNQQTQILQAPAHNGQPSLPSSHPLATARGMENEKPRGPLPGQAAYVW